MNAKGYADYSPAKSLTPSEQRLLRIFASVPEHAHSGFFHLMGVICHGCNWAPTKSPVQAVDNPSNVIDAEAFFSVRQRIDAIPLFGSRNLTRSNDGRSWLFSSASTVPEPCTEREAMFINAALRAAGGQ